MRSSGRRTESKSLQVVQRRCQRRQPQLQRPGPAEPTAATSQAARRSFVNARWRANGDWSLTSKPACRRAELNPNDPLVNTASEYMVQMATIAHHTLDSVQTVVLDKDVTLLTARSSRPAT